MKIDSGQIDYSALRVIENIVGNPDEYSACASDQDNERLLVIGAIRGVLDLANELRTVLKI